jgi:hypothetical protein
MRPSAALSFVGTLALATSATAQAAPTAAADVEAFPLVGSAPTQDVQVIAPRADVQVRSERPGLSLQQRVGGGWMPGYRGARYFNGFAQLCTAPCRLQMPSGVHPLGVGEFDGSATLAEPFTLPPGKSTLYLGYKSNESTRTWGLVTLIGGSTLAPIAMIAIAYSDGYNDCSSGRCQLRSSRWLPAALVGTGLLIASTTLGLVWMLEGDEATIRLVPGHAAPPTGDARLDQRFDAKNLAGLSVVASF